LVTMHTSGTSGTMSFLPWTRVEWDRYMSVYMVSIFQTFGQNASPQSLPLNMQCIFPGFRSGGLSSNAMNDQIVEKIAGSEERFHAAYPGRLSADMMLLAARYRTAAAKGQLDRLQITPEMEARRAEFEVQQRDMPRQGAEFFDTMRTKLAGQRVFMMATTPMLFRLAKEGLAQGMRNAFSSSSLLATGGGGKGIALPDNWEEMVAEFFGTKNIVDVYGMSEGGGPHRKCKCGNYHIPPWTIPYILDADTMQAKPRKGRQEGVFAFYDLIPEARWGGFVTQDDVAVEFDAPCACGQKGPYVTGKIRRLSETRGEQGEEKLSCAAAPEAYADALAFLNEVN